MILLFEGPDRAGKDTHIREIEKIYKEMFFKKIFFTKILGVRDEIGKAFSKAYYQDALHFILRNQEENLIINRFFFSEYVYASLYRNYEADFVIDLANQMVKELNDKILLIMLISEPYHLSLIEDGKSLSHGKENLIKQEIKRFEDSYNYCGLKNKLLINTKQNSIQETTKIIFNKITEMVKGTSL